ncbi:Cytochrome P450 4V2 [Irineochytrium annulatum]|nr:Cytochrome P450 4V2 [Irineochytrium annulatum]
MNPDPLAAAAGAGAGADEPAGNKYFAALGNMQGPDKHWSYYLMNWVWENIASLLMFAPFAIAIWWKSLISSQAHGVLSSKDASLAPATEVTFGSLGRKALAFPARVLADARRLGGYYVTFVMAAPLVLTSDPAIASVIFSERFKCERMVYNAEARGILKQNGPQHHRSRRILTAALNDARASKSLLAIINRRLKSEVFPEMDESVSTKQPIDLLPIFEELFADSFTLWLTGALDEEDKTSVERIVEARRTLADLKFIVPTGIAWYFDRLRDLVPLLEYLVFLPGSKDYYIRTHAKTKARQIMTQALESAKSRRENASAAKKSGDLDPFLNRLQDASEADSEPFTWDELRETLEAVQISAEQPMFCAVPNLLLCLAHDRSTQKQIHLELAKVPRSSTEPVRSEDLRAVPHLEMAVRESLRVLPPRPFSYNRSSSANVYKLPGLWSLPKGYHVAVDLLSLHRRGGDAKPADGAEDKPAAADPARTDGGWGPDPDVFRPERFKKDVGLREGESSFGDAFVPFGAGVYGCPAQRLAMEVIRCVAAEVLRRYELTGVEDADLSGPTDLNGYSSSQGGTLRHLAGSPVILKKRK